MVCSLHRLISGYLQVNHMVIDATLGIEQYALQEAWETFHMHIDHYVPWCVGYQGV